MFRPFKRRDKRSKLEIEIDDLLEEMSYQSRASNEYAKNVEFLELLYKSQSYEAKKMRISPDTMVLILANLVGILLVLHYEKFDTISSRAFNLIVKGRV